MRDKHAAGTRFRVFSLITVCVLMIGAYIIGLCIAESYQWLGCERSFGEKGEDWLNKDYWLCRYVFFDAHVAFEVNVVIMVFILGDMCVCVAGAWYSFGVLYAQYCGPFNMPSTLASSILHDNLM